MTVWSEYLWAQTLTITDTRFSHVTQSDLESALYSHLFTYPPGTFDVDIGSIFNKILHFVHFATPNCLMQGSPLREETKDNKKKLP